MEAFAWPATALIFGVAFLLVFRAPIARKIDRLSRAGKDGVSFERPQEVEPSKDESLSFDELMKLPISATVLERERLVQAQLARHALKTDSERIAVLARVVASHAAEIEFTRIAHVIFGSQLNFLVQLAGTKHGLTAAEAEVTYKQAAAAHEALYADRPFEAWFGYLQNSGLVRTNDGRIDITQLGADFLKYLVDARLAYDRYG